MFDKHFPIALELKSNVTSINKYKMIEYCPTHAYAFHHEDVKLPFELFKTKNTTVLAKLYRSNVEGVSSFLVIPHTDPDYKSIMMVVIPVTEIDVAGEQWDFMTEDYVDLNADRNNSENAFFKADLDNVTVWGHLEKPSPAGEETLTSLDGNDLMNIVKNLFTLAVTHECSKNKEVKEKDAVYASNLYPEFDDDIATNKEVFIHELGIAFMNVVEYDNDTIEDLQMTVHYYENEGSETVATSIEELRENVNKVIH